MSLEQKKSRGLVDYFLHPSLRNESDQHYRARILIAVLMIFMLLLIVTGATLLAFPPLSIMIGEPLCALIVFGIAGLLIKIRRDGDYLFCSIGAIMLVFLPVLIGIAVSSGVANSPVTPLLVVPPLMAYFFGGLRWGRYMFAASLFAILIFLILEVSGTAFFQTINTQELRALTQFLVWFVNLGAVSGIAFTYESAAVALKRERDDEHEKYIRLAKLDPLTGLANRRNFETILQELIALYGAQNPARRFTLGYLDLDGFKPINDRYGHAVGDEVLRAVSERLRKVLRASDFVGRHGGDEFMLLLDEVCELPCLEMMARRVLGSIVKPINTSAGKLSVSGSLGFAMFPLDADELEALKNAADAAMYEAKRSRSGWYFYRPGLQVSPS